MNIVLVVTAGIGCKQFYKIQEYLQKDNNVKILFTENAQKMLKNDLYYYFRHENDYKLTCNIIDEKGLYSQIAGRGKQFYSYNERLKKFSCCFDANENAKGGFEHELYLYQQNNKIEHFELSDFADKVIISPCTFNTYNKVNNGIADTFVLSFLNAFLGTSKPLYYVFDESYNRLIKFDKKADKTQITQFSNSFKKFVDFNGDNNINNMIQEILNEKN